MSSVMEFLHLLLLFSILLSCSKAQIDFSETQIPNPFRRGNMYPPRSEIQVCRPIEDYIDRGSQRFDTQLVTNNNPDIVFATQDSRIMSSRLQSRLNRLASSRSNSDPQIRVLKAWTPFPDSELAGNSLHYEGRTVRIRLDGGSHDDYSELLTDAVDAQFDWVFFENDNYVRLSVIPSSCDRNIDVVFILDQSGSVKVENHDLAKEFISNVVSFFTISRSHTRVGVVTYSTNSRIQFDLNRYTDLASLTAAIDAIGYPGGWTATALALDDARRALNPSNNYGARPASEGIPKIAILITDGKSNQYSINGPANDLKNSGVQVYTIGVGNYDLDELRFISSDPDDEHVFLLSSYRDALAFVDFLSVTTCESQAIVSTCETTFSTVPQDTLQYFQADCNSFGSTVQVQLTDNSGTSFLYCSTTATNPGPLTAGTVSDERTGVTTRECVLSISGNTETVYIGVQGQSTMNEFSLVVMDQILQRNRVVDSVVEGETYFFGLASLLLPEVASQSWEYEIVDGNTNNVFRIANGQSFRIRGTSVGSISYETQPQYNVLVVVERSGSPCRCAQIHIQLNIIPNRIDFDVTPDDASVSEDAAIDTDVAMVMATSGAGQISFSIIAGNTDNAFSIDSSTGEVEVASALDFETTQSYTLTVRADVMGTSVSDTTSFVITVLDVNEPPFFLTQCARQGSCSFSLNENQMAGTGVGDIQADDPDLGNLPNGMLRYSISPLSDFFVISSTGAITTSQPLDFEASSSHSFNVVVRDSSLSISAAVVVTVNDLNDNEPIISGESQVSIDENTPSGFGLVQYSATDRDSGTNAIIEFSLTSSGGFLPFDIDTSQGLLSVTGVIDYESVQSYDITVTATNPGTALSSSINTRITVNNLNDNRPLFVGVPYSGTVVEHTSTAVGVRTVQATDNDLGSAGTIRYSINSGNFGGSFQIDSETGAISVARDIDRETVSEFVLRVRARDLGDPEMRRTTSVSITVSDINDNRPVFNPSTYSAEVREDTSTGTELFTVFAFDSDEANNPNSELVYSITSGNTGSVFSIDDVSGVVSLDSGLDFETENSYSLTIVATDRGFPSLQGSATATVTVTDVNDVPPSVNGSINIELSENSPSGIVVVDYEAVDPDSVVTFSIRSGNEEGKFFIDPTSGVVTLVSSLDYETTHQYIIRILVSDGDQTAPSNLTVDVLDENEFAPVFEGPVSFEILEESASGSLVGTVTATDGDGTAPNNLVMFSFAQMSAINQYLSLDASSGEIRTVGVLDREELTQIFIPPSSRQSVTIVARDQGTPSQQSFVTITITLVDINDNTPLFGDTSYQNSLLENLSPPQTVFQLTATDADLGTNAEIRYMFELTDNTGASVPFQIDEVNGLVETVEELDCEQQANYTFTLTAVDLGTPSRSSIVTGVLNIIDENDNSPVFSMDPYVVPISESASSETSVAMVEASDADKGLNGEIEYFVINEDIMVETGENEIDDAPFVSIDSLTGEITLDTQFNYERQLVYNVTVIAVDRGVPRRSSSAQLAFFIQNFDESPPMFPDICEFTVSEDAPLNEQIAECLATDEDNIATSPDQALVSYGIFSGNSDGIFAINTTTGGISLVRSLDRETDFSHTITIEARDLSGQSSFREVTFFVADENDNSPQFSGSPYSYDFTVSRIRSHTQELMTVSATDADIEENGEITYSIAGVVRNGLTTRIEITAVDGGSPSRMASAELVITFESSCLLQEYGIDESSGRVYAFVLCSVTISPPINITLGGTNSFSCSVLYNSRLIYQWIHNGTFITPQETVPNRETMVSYSVTGARYSDQGEFACKVSSQAGSVQSVTSMATIQVPPVITIPPVNQASKEGDRVELTCKAVGVPDPIIEWFRDTEKVFEGSTYIIEEMEAANAGVYTCAATNSDQGKPAVAIATLTFYKPDNVVELDLDKISNPSEDGSCHHIDYDAITSVIEDLTKQTALITEVEGEDICEVTPCAPNPCQNRGSCSLDDRSLDGYQCSCFEGYTGKDCTEDVEECAGNPCGSEGTCVEALGNFQCTCGNGTHGHRCQYLNTCETTDNCTDGTICVDISGGGFRCVAQPDRNTAVVVRGLTTVAGFLNDFLQSYLERQASAFSRRRKRQLVFLTFCEPRFVEIDDDTYALVWLCAPGDMPPSLADQTSLCEVLLESGYTQTCALPGGDEMVPPTPPSLPETTATIDIIVIKSSSSQPLDSDIIVMELEQRGAREQISMSTGAEVTKIASQPQVETGGGASNDSTSTAAGAAIGVLLALCVVAGLIVALVLGTIKYKEHSRRQRQKKNHAIEKAISLHSLNAELYESRSSPPHLKSTNSSTELLKERNGTGSPTDPSALPPVTTKNLNGDAGDTFTNHAAISNDS